MRQDTANLCVSLERELKIKWNEKKIFKIGQLEAELRKTALFKCGDARAQAQIYWECLKSEPVDRFWKFFFFIPLDFRFSF